MDFWDTSAIVSLVLFQREAEALAAVAEASGGRLALWWGTEVEAVSAVARLARPGEVGADRAARALGQISEIVSRAQEVPPSEGLRAAALRAVRIHPLTAADALQLAAALVWTDHSPSGVGFVCLDDRLREAARREGFEVLPRAR
ncbi:MAG: hypothetical protein ACE149_16860 [Armatimonadota bacterium]